jgi:DNA-binding NarL/FixJ family response regulator
MVGAREHDERGLTPTQLQVAELVTQGLTNREVGERLFMSPHTVEAHLTATYRALDIRSRAELADALHSRPPRDSASEARDSSVISDPEP